MANRTDVSADGKDRLVWLDSPYGKMLIAQDDEIRNGHAGTVVGRMTTGGGYLVNWRGIGERITPEHWLKWVE